MTGGALVFSVFLREISVRLFSFAERVLDGLNEKATNGGNRIVFQRFPPKFPAQSPTCCCCFVLFFVLFFGLVWFFFQWRISRDSLRGSFFQSGSAESSIVLLSITESVHPIKCDVEFHRAGGNSLTMTHLSQSSRRRSRFSLSLSLSLSLDFEWTPFITTRRATSELAFSLPFPTPPSSASLFKLMPTISMKVAAAPPIARTTTDNN